MDGKVVVITGSNIGIGRETAAADDVKERCGSGDAHVVNLDLADLATVRSCAEDIKASWPRLVVLINNAGGMWTQRSTTAQGFEQTFGVNHLGHFYLTTLLLDRLQASAPARVINVSSVAHHLPVRGLRWHDLQTEHRRYTA